jgi:cell division protein FtsX
MKYVQDRTREVDRLFRLVLILRVCSSHICILCGPFFIHVFVCSFAVRQWVRRRQPEQQDSMASA